MVVQFQNRIRARVRLPSVAFQADGNPIWFCRPDLPSEPLPGVLLVDRNGRVIVTLLDGTLVCRGLAGNSPRAR